jgi:hypothetical protein
VGFLILDPVHVLVQLFFAVPKKMGEFLLVEVDVLSLGDEVRVDDLLLDAS